MIKLTKSIIIRTLVLSMMAACQTSPMVNTEIIDESVHLPYIKNTANECYYLDEFMPIPDNLVSGRSGKLRLRYYTYKSAKYKEFKNQHIILSFYSTDEQCWSLFEEYYVKE